MWLQQFISFMQIRKECIKPIPPTYLLFISKYILHRHIETTVVLILSHVNINQATLNYKYIIPGLMDNKC